MNLFTRPSKSFLFDYLESLLSHERGEIGIDAAAERIKNRYMFKTQVYYGIDRDKEALVRGLKSNPGENVIAIHGDLTNLKKIPDSIADVVLSSNTLYQIPDLGRGKAVSELARLADSRGLCILEFTKDSNFPAMLSIVRNIFTDIKIIYFKNPISRFYERLAYGNPPKERWLFATIPMRCFSWIVSRLEYLTNKSAKLNTHVLVIARDKKEKKSRNSFVITNLEKIGDRIYSAM